MQGGGAARARLARLARRRNSSTPGVAALLGRRRRPAPSQSAIRRGSRSAACPAGRELPGAGVSSGGAAPLCRGCVLCVACSCQPAFSGVAFAFGIRASGQQSVLTLRPTSSPNQQGYVATEVSTGAAERIAAAIEARAFANVVRSSAPARASCDLMLLLLLLYALCCFGCHGSYDFDMPQPPTPPHPHTHVFDLSTQLAVPCRRGRQLT